MKRNNAFERFTDDLLRTHAFNDKLRSALKGDSDIGDTIDQILFESQLEAFFIESDVSDEEYDKIYGKLNRLKAKLNDKYLFGDYSKDEILKKDISIVEMIELKYSERNCLLSKEILLYLNGLNDKYK